MQKKDAYWGWYVVAGAFFIVGINYGARYCFGVFLKPMGAEYGWSRSVISVAVSLAVFAYGVGGIVTGRLLDRMAPRWIMTIGATVAGVSLMLVRFVREPWQFYLFYGLLCGAGSSCLGVVVCSSSVGKWFVRKRGMAIGIASVGIGVGTMILAPLSGYIVKNYGWRDGFTFLGITTILIGVILSQIFMGKTRPEDYGLMPDGEVMPPECKTEPKAVMPTITSMGVVLGDRRYWILVFCFTVGIMAQMAAFVHQVAYAIDNRIGEIAAASSLGLIGVGSIGGKFFFGWLSDRLKDAKYSACLGFACMALGMFTLIHADTAGLLTIYAVLYGFGYGSLAPMMPYLLADRFGRYVLGRSYGLLTFFAAGLGGGLGPILCGYIYDHTGSYSWAWYLILSLLVFVSLLVLTVKPRDPALQG
ncbi:MAG: MFS transporter [Smithellaceae bacterium]|nr:MFS transporter [Smithellaceae bacterium]